MNIVLMSFYNRPFRIENNVFMWKQIIPDKRIKMDKRIIYY